MPTHGFRWLAEQEIKDNFSTIEDILKLSDDAEDGFTFEVDIDNPKDLHDLHND